MTLEEKIAALEGSLRWQRRLTVLLLLAVVGLVLGGVSHRMEDQVIETLRVRSLEVLNGRGRVAALLSTRKDGGFLDVRNRLGASGFIAHGDLSGGRVGMYDASGRVTMAMAHKNGSPLLVLKRQKDKATAILGIHRNGPVMTLKSIHNKTLYYLGLSDNRGRMTLDLFNPAGARVAGLRSGEKGEGLVQACTAAGQCRTFSPTGGRMASLDRTGREVTARPR